MSEIGRFLFTAHSMGRRSNIVSDYVVFRSSILAKLTVTCASTFHRFGQVPRHIISGSNTGAMVSQLFTFSLYPFCEVY